MTQTIMIIDDEIEILDMLKRYFSLEGYHVITAARGKEALQKLSKQPDLILLDKDSDKIKGFGAGGDDYIIKPFSVDELGARVSAHLRRENRSKTKSRVLFDGQLAVDYLERTVYWDGKEIPLLKKEFDILEVLSQNPGQVFDKERLYEAAWGLDGLGNNSVVAEHIRKIRAKFAAVGAKQYIETVWGVGYKWEKASVN